MGMRMSQDCIRACPSTGAKEDNNERKSESEGFVKSEWQQARNTPLWTEAMVKALDYQGKRGWFSLMDKVHSRTALSRAWARVDRNAGAAGVDGITTARFSQGHAVYLPRLQDALRDGSYRPGAIKRVLIPKADGGERPLGIPTVLDRVAQAAVLEVIEPIFEQVFEETSFGFRPGRSCKGALREVLAGFDSGLHYVVDADLKSYFDSIPQAKLMARVFEQIKDGSVLRLIERFLGQKIVSELDSWTPTSGTPQGAVLSPLLANIYLHPLDMLMRESGFRMLRYADDFVVLCASAADAERGLSIIQSWVSEAGLTLHPDKTRIADLTKEAGYIDFLGYRFQRKGRRIERRIKPKKMTALKAKIRDLIPRTSGKSMAVIIEKLNQTLRGIFEYFKQVSGWQQRGRRASDLETLDARVRFRLRRMLAVRLRRLKSGHSLQAHKKWRKQYFHDLGLFSLQSAQDRALHPH